MAQYAMSKQQYRRFTNICETLGGDTSAPVKGAAGGRQDAISSFGTILCVAFYDSPRSPALLTATHNIKTMLPTESQPCFFQISATLVLTASQYCALFSTLDLLRAPSDASTYHPASLAKRTMATKDRTRLPGTLLLIGTSAMSIESSTGIMRYSGSRFGPSRARGMFFAGLSARTLV